MDCVLKAFSMSSLWLSIKHNKAHELIAIVVFFLGVSLKVGFELVARLEGSMIYLPLSLSRSLSLCVQVVSKVCMLMQVPSLRSVGIIHAWHIPAVKDLQYTIREINMFLEVRLL